MNRYNILLFILAVFLFFLTEVINNYIYKSLYDKNKENYVFIINFIEAIFICGIISIPLSFRLRVRG
jgi:hypothetical protein